jgi:hypothetical protein
MWAESKVIEAAQREGIEPDPDSCLLFLAHCQILQYRSNLARIEQMFPVCKEIFENLKNSRFSCYTEWHPFYRIQPYMVTHRLHIPDYGLYDKSSFSFF